MEDIIFDITYTSLQQMFIKIFLFLFVSILFVFLIYFILTKVLFRRNKHRKEVNLRLILLWAIFIYLILFNVYIFFLLRINGIDSLQWTYPRFYLGIIAQLLVYISLIIYFFIRRHSLKQIIDEKSVN
jgi:hypothetical protein